MIIYKWLVATWFKKDPIESSISQNSTGLIFNARSIAVYFFYVKPQKRLKYLCSEAWTWEFWTWKSDTWIYNGSGWKWICIIKPSENIVYELKTKLQEENKYKKAINLEFHVNV